MCKRVVCQFASYIIVQADLILDDILFLPLQMQMCLNVFEDFYQPCRFIVLP